jgi:hypothetical protein
MVRILQKFECKRFAEIGRALHWLVGVSSAYAVLLMPPILQALLEWLEPGHGAPIDCRVVVFQSAISMFKRSPSLTCVDKHQHTFLRFHMMHMHEL